MCEATTILAITSAVLAVGSTTTSLVMQQQSAKAQAGAEAEAAKNAAATDYLRAEEQQNQNNAAAANDMTERLKQSLRERAALRTASGEAGVSGGREELASYQSESHDLAVIEENRNNTNAQIEAEKQSIHANAQGRINMANARVPSGVAAGLQIGTGVVASGLSGFSSGYTLGKGLK